MSENVVVVEDTNLYTTVVTASSVAILALYYVFNVAQKPKIYASNGALQKFLDKHLPTVKETYWPSWFGFNGLVQSALGLNLRIAKTEKLPYRREILQLSDGGQLALDFLGENDEDDGKLVVLLLPGLTSSSNTSYVKTLAMTIVKSGAIVAVLNNRGLGGVPLKTARTYCCTNNEDIREVIGHLKTKHPKSKYLAIGTSLGGMMLSRYLISWPEESKSTFIAAMVISICWDAIIGNQSLEKPFLNRYIVNATLTSNLQNLAKRHRSMLETRDCWDFDKIFSVSTIREFDDHFTAPQFGFKNWKEYYTAAQITPEIHKFSIPVFGLNAIDDPMQPGEYLPIKQAIQDGSNLALIVTERGGHLGFLESAFPFRTPFHYMERIVGEFVSGIRLHAGDLSSYDDDKSLLLEDGESASVVDKILLGKKLVVPVVHETQAGLEEMNNDLEKNNSN